MSLRLKLAITLVVLSVGASISVGLLTYRATSVELRSQLDSSLDAAAKQLRAQPVPVSEGERRNRAMALRALRAFRAPGDTSAQVIGPRGQSLSTTGMEIPVTQSDINLARSEVVDEAIRTISIDNQDYRLLTRSLGNGRGAVQVIRSTEEIDTAQRGIARRIVISTFVVAIFAATIGWLLARQATRRLQSLAETAERVAATADPNTRVDIVGRDETGRLAAAFNAMLASLVEVRENQRRLIQNAGHELRTPLTSLRTNVYTLRNSDGLSGSAREAVLEDLSSEAEELTNLVNEVIELATEGRGTEESVEVELGHLVRHVALRAAKRTGRSIEVQVDASVVSGHPGGLARCVSNLIENALKFDQGSGSIQVECTAGVVAVHDRGPGLDESDVPFIFERFYRSDTARSLPGSGLGLAIVSEIIQAHNGYVWARNRDGGGAVIGFALPVLQ